MCGRKTTQRSARNEPACSTYCRDDIDAADAYFSALEAIAQSRTT